MATVNGTQGNDQLSGTTDADTINGLGGNDTIFANSGNDWIEGGAGNDALSGGSGQDSYVFREYGNANADTVANFDTGWDNLQLDAAAFSAIGAAGRFASGDVRFYAAAGATGGHDADDRIVYDTSTGNLYYDADGSGSGTAQLIATFQGAPTLAASDINVFGTATPPPGTINGTSGNDSLVGTSGNDTINGFDGNDTLDGGAGADSMVGGNGDDLYFVDDTGDQVVEFENGGQDEVRTTLLSYTLPDWVNDLTLLDGSRNGYGNALDNIITGGALGDGLRGEAGNDTLIGGDGNDNLLGGLGNDSISGGAGDDVIALDSAQLADNSTQGSDTVDGGAGFDFVGFSTEGVSSTAAVTVDLAAGTYSIADPAGTVSGVLLNVEAVQGTTHDDRISGNDVANTLDGFFGNDTLDGRLGNDTLTGGGGADSFNFTTAPGAANADTITDFAGGTDKIRLDASVMTALGAAGNFSSGDPRFYSAAGATGGHDADDRVVYDTSSGNLWYDADGSGTGTAQLIATLQGAPSLAATDIAVDNGTSSGGGIGGNPPPPPPGSIVGTEGNDTLSGGSGNDTIYGLGGNDFLSGNDGADSIVGGAGNDTIYGNAGNDWIEGTTGNDSLSGGGGQDSYVFREYGASNADAVGNFSSGWDNLQLDAGGFGAIGATGRFASGDVRFYAASGATGGHDADDRLVYDTSTGNLYFDADGSGSGTAQLIATFQGAPSIAATDITVFGTPAPSGSVINGTAGNDTLVGTSGNDTINGFGGDDSIVGAGGFDSLIGGDGNDTLDGTSVADQGGEAQEADTMDGGLGNDTYIVGANDLIAGDAGGIDTVRTLDTSWTLGAGLENLVLGQSPRVDGSSGTGNSLNNVIDASGLDHGGTLSGLAGNDTIFTAQNGALVLGGDGNDELHGHKSDVSGGAGNDTIFTDGTDLILFDVAPGTSNADQIIGGSSLIQIDGNAYTNIGASGNFATDDPRFYAAAGASAGHDADDRVLYDTSTGNLWYDADGSGSGAAQLMATFQGAPTFQSSFISVVNGRGGEVINGTAGDDSLVGGAGVDTLNGFDGNDTLDGGVGGDSMVGGNGDDLYFVDNAGDVVVEAQNGGTDEVRSSISSYTLPDWVNNLTLVGSASTGFGNGIENAMRTSDSAGGELHGAGGNDTLTSGAAGGNLYGDAGNDVLNGSAMGELLEGGGGDDTIAAGGGDDQIYMLFDHATETGYGHDVIDGGAGFDWLYYFDQTTQGGLTVDFAAGTVSNAQGSASIANIEAVFGTNNNDVMTGSTGNDRFLGEFGNDTLNGGAGNDTLVGDQDGSGNQGADLFILADAPGAANADHLTDFFSGVDTLQLDASVMTALGASGRFGAGDARFYSAAGATSGHDADDRIVFDTSTGNLYYDADGSGTGSSALIATIGYGSSPLASTDITVVNGTTPPPPQPGQSLSGTTGNDTLVGGSGNDTIYGNSGNDWIEGRGGNDVVSGGSGQDSYVFREYGAPNADSIANFDTGWDALRLDSSVFTALGGAGHFSSGDARFYAAAGASGGHDGDDRIVYNTSTGQLYYDADGSGAGGAELIATIQGAPTVAAGDIYSI